MSKVVDDFSSSFRRQL